MCITAGVRKDPSLVRDKAPNNTERDSLSSLVVPGNSAKLGHVSVAWALA